MGSRLGAFSLLPMETIGGSLSVYAGQNKGADNNGRIRQGVKASIIINLAVSTVLGGLLLVFGKQLSLLFLPEASDEILSASYRYLLFAAVPGFFYGLMFVYQYVLRGVGLSRESMYGSFAQLGGRIAVAVLGAFILKNLDIVWLSWPVSYIAGTIYPLYFYRKALCSTQSQ